MKEDIKISIGIFIIFLAGCWVGYVFHSYRSSVGVGTSPPASALPSVADIQRRVGAEPDGKFGPETQKLWDRAYCDQSATKIHPVFRLEQK